MSEHYQVIVIGSGSGGKDAAMLAARAGLRVLVVEKQSLGGTCFHRGCNAIRALRRARCTMERPKGVPASVSSHYRNFYLEPCSSA
jgi:pyruvate/2-oxoglutarate dehydrogenase complex dihydrolipoamide dehydrogenase (E3) component